MNLTDKARALGFDPAELRELLDLFVETSLADLQTLQAALDQNRPEPAVIASHSIKGAARSLGFDELSAKLETIESNARRNSLVAGRELLESVRAEIDAIVQALRKFDSTAPA